MFPQSILIAAVALSCLATFSATTQAALLDDQVFANGALSVPFNDLLPPLFETETSTVADDDKANPTFEPAETTTPTPKPIITATTTTNASLRPPARPMDKSNKSKFDASIGSEQQAAVLALPFNDLLPPLLEPIASNDVPAVAETKLAASIVRMTTRKPAAAPQPATFKSSAGKQTAFGAIKAKPITVKPDTPKKYYKKPIIQQQQQQNSGKYNANAEQYAAQLRAGNVQEYINNYYYTTYRPPKASLPTITPFPRRLQ